MRRQRVILNTTGLLLRLLIIWNLSVPETGRQEVYAACSNALNSLVMGELVEGKGRFMDQIINAVWYFSEQTWWGWSAHLDFQKAGAGLPDINEPFVDLGVGEIAMICHGHGTCLMMSLTKFIR